jgi:hypothetical protein
VSTQAETIADAILSASSMGRATRIALKQKQADGAEKDLGGLNRIALVQIIEKALAATTLEQPAAKN